MKPDAPPSVASLPAGLPESWTFGRDFPCPRCHYNLRALHSPHCPECGLEFRWQSVLAVVCPTCGHPLHDEDGPLCPRCFQTLNWAQLLGQTDPHQRFEFEFAAPMIRPFINTFGRTFWPWAFWSPRRFDAPSNPARLNRYLAVSVAIGLIGLLMPMLGRLLGATYIDFWEWLGLVSFILVPSATGLATIAYLGRTRVAPYQPPPKTHRILAFSASILAWTGALLTFATVAATVANYVVSFAFGGVQWRPATALYFASAHLIHWVRTGEVRWSWHAVEAWFNVGVYGLLALQMLAWWPVFLVLAIRRGFRMRRRAVLQIVGAILLISALLILSLWLKLMPESPLFDDWVRPVRER